MRVPLMLIAGLIAIAQPALAQDTPEARKALATEYVGIVESDSMLVAINNAVWPSVEASIRKDNPKVNEAALVSLKQISIDVSKATVAKLVAIEADLYAEEFTLDELQDIVDFYKSPTGAKLLANRPKLMARLTPQLMEAMKLMEGQMEDQMKQAALEKGLKF